MHTHTYKVFIRRARAMANSPENQKSLDFRRICRIMPAGLSPAKCHNKKCRSYDLAGPYVTAPRPEIMLNARFAIIMRPEFFFFFHGTKKVISIHR